MNITKSLLTTLLLTLPAGCALQAASITGKVTAKNGITVVYVDAVPGKTFPAPEKHFVMDQKAVMFQPHVLVLPVGATVDFQNSDSVAHNVFWPSIAGNKKDSHNLGTWPKGQARNFKFDTRPARTRAGICPSKSTSLPCSTRAKTRWPCASPTPGPNPTRLSRASVMRKSRTASRIGTSRPAASGKAWNSTIARACGWAAFTFPPPRTAPL